MLLIYRPMAAYRLIPRSNAEVAYARATPAGGPPPHVFRSHPVRDHSAMTLLWRKTTIRSGCAFVYCKSRLRKRRSCSPIQRSEDRCEALVHVRTAPAEGVASITRDGATVTPLASWDTVTVLPGECPALSFKAGSAALVLVVLAV